MVLSDQIRVYGELSLTDDEVFGTESREKILYGDLKIGFCVGTKEDLVLIEDVMEGGFDLESQPVFKVIGLNRGGRQTELHREER